MFAIPKSVQLKAISCFAFLMILYGGIYNLSTSRNIKANSIIHENEKMFIRKGKVLLLLSSQRSGSSFLGEFFAQFSRGFYLYEPLLPYGTSCDQLENERMQFLKHISQCDFNTLKSSYSFAYSTGNVKSHRECLSAHVCSPARHKTIIQRYHALCESFSMYQDVENRNCGLPLNLTIWSSLCHSSKLVAFKLLRVCSMEYLEKTVAELTSLGNDVYIIDLVRDPRGIINSALHLELRSNVIGPRLDRVCGNYQNSMDYIDKHNTDITSKSVITDGKYLRVRYEDIATHPVEMAEKIYDFMNINLPPEVREWIELSTSKPSEKIDELRASLDKESLTPEEILKVKKKMSRLYKENRHPYGTVRDSSEVVVKWRKTLKMQIIDYIQKKCGNIMTKLGYKLINSIEERNDLTKQLWE